MKRTAFILIFVTLLLSCAREPQIFTETEASAEIACRAFEFAKIYADSETMYGWGKQDPARAVIQIDCSGLVVMCYKYALVDTKYQLLVSDMSAAYMYEHATKHVKMNELRKGDLIFMGEPDSNAITHIAIFEKIESGNIYFIDSTLKDTDGDGKYDVNGVSRRFYEINNPRFKSFGIMRLKY